jgi:hypothetical protein
MRLLEVESERNGPYVLVYDWDEWPKRVRDARGWTSAKTIYERPATPEEQQEVKRMMRCYCVFYKSLNDVLNDELSYGVDGEALRTLQALTGKQMDPP